MNTIPAIPKIYTLGTRFNADIFDGPTVIEEKIDGSQFSFANTEDGLFECRSKGQKIDLNDPGMFSAAIPHLLDLQASGSLPRGYIFQCEYLAKPKHNVLAYSRIPKNHLVLFDVRDHTGTYVSSAVKIEWALRLELEPVPTFANCGTVTQFTFPALQVELLEKESALGGVKLEGFVIKNYSKPHPESASGKSPMTAKVVADRFKEKMACRPCNPKAGPGEFVQSLVNSLRTESRWLKAIQHLKESNQLVNDNRDIGPLCREIQRDVLEEETDWIKQQLFDEFSKEIAKGVVNGFAQFYQKLLSNGPSVWQNEQIEKQNVI